MRETFDIQSTLSKHTSFVRGNSVHLGRMCVYGNMVGIGDSFTYYTHVYSTLCMLINRKY